MAEKLIDSIVIEQLMCARSGAHKLLLRRDSGPSNQDPSYLRFV